MNACIQDELMNERQNSEALRQQLEEALGREDRNMEDMEALQIHIQVERWRD